MADIYEMFGRLSEVHAQTEANRQFLHELVSGLQSGRIDPQQIEPLPDGGFRVKPPPEPVKPESED